MNSGDTYSSILIISKVMAITSRKVVKSKRVIRRLAATVAFPKEIGRITMESLAYEGFQGSVEEVLICDILLLIFGGVCGGWRNVRNPRNECMPDISDLCGRYFDRQRSGCRC